MMKRAISFIIVFICLALAGHLSAFADNELPAPTNIGWKDGSTATATWDAVEGADYYRVHVYVYDNGTVIGDTITGTAACEIDVQQEIVHILTDPSKYSVVQVTFSTCGSTIDSGGDRIYGQESQQSQQINYDINLLYLATPTNAEITQDGMAMWDVGENVDHYTLYLGYSKNENDNRHRIYGTGVYTTHLTVENGRAKYDISETFSDFYRYLAGQGYIEPGEAVYYSMWIQANAAGTSPYIDSAWSEESNAVLFLERKSVESITLSPSAPILYLGNSLYLGRTIAPEDAIIHQLAIALPMMKQFL